jgi:CMP-N-acetylneuraminic acid synthetase
MIVAFIPARGGSKRLPRKNIRVFAGQPLIAHSIAQAQASRFIDRCVVSTDDEETGGIAQRYGAEVVWRPAELATDTASTGAAAQHLLQAVAPTGCEALVTLQPNCPLRPTGLIDQAVDLFRTLGADSVVSVTKTVEKWGTIEQPWFRPSYRPGTRGQEMPDRYYENGVLYVSRADLVLQTAGIFGARVAPLVLDALYARGDIDTELDFEIAQFLFERYRHPLAPAANAQGEKS